MRDGREALGKVHLWIGWTVVLLLLTSADLRATHVIGGDISMRAVGTTPGLFRIQLNQYWDETKTGTGNRDPFVTLLIYRKQNPRLIDTLRLNLQEALPLTFNNASCAKSLALNFTEARYFATYQFDPALYTDPGGYYMVWERCCRNDALTNAVSVGMAGVAMVFYLEFPPMQVSNRPLINSSPDFGIPNGDYICVNKPFTFNVGATDADGDQLRYSLVTPLNGYTDRTTTLGDKSVKADYPPITWAPGIGLTNVIPGNPPLTINPATGQLRVQASQQGLFLFTVQCEEFRNGQRIGLVRRDFQLPVIDCSPNTPPPAVVTVDKIAQTNVVSCPGQTLTLAITPNPLYAYQWQRDGANLRGDTLPTLNVEVSGRYTVVTSQASVCSNDTVSQGVQVTIATPPSVSLSAVNQPPYCAGDTVTLRAGGQAGYVYRWRRDGRDLVGERQATLRVSQSGQYVVLARPASAVCDGADTVQVLIGARPVVSVTASATAFCADASAQLTAQTSPGDQYVWQRNGSRLPDTTIRLTVRQSGKYQVRVTNPAGCTAASATLALTRYEPPAVQFDSIAPVCGSSPVVPLRGQPGGGVYAGPGVTGDQFSPSVAGVGRHQLTYTVTDPNGCPTEQSRSVLVTPGPALTGSTLYQLVKGDSVRLQTQASEPISRYQWDPPANLSRTDVASPVANPTQTTRYQLTAVGATGCLSTLSVQVDVMETIYIPSAFTPNGDGLNDAWLIPNITSFPLCEVAVYNRWGELVFFSKGYAQPWDGTYRQELVGAGVYTYHVSTGSSVFRTTYRGKVTVIH
ncbi:T9SS type B sorting domain-containing protein [Spirosoma arcticum]